MKKYLKISTMFAFAALTVASTACGSTTSTGGGAAATDDTASGTDTTAGSDTGATTDTTSTSDTKTTSDTATGSDTKTTNDGTTTTMDAMSGDMMGGGDGSGGGDGGGGGNDPCQPCMQSKCGAELGACSQDPTCISGMQGVGDCMKAAADAAASQKCIDDFAATSGAAKTFVTCVETNCKAECIN